MSGQTPLSNGDSQSTLQVETEKAASSWDGAPPRKTRYLCTGLGIAILSLFGLVACALRPFGSHSSAEPSALDPEVAFAPMVGPRGTVQARHPQGIHAARHQRPVAFLPQNHAASPQGSRLASLAMGHLQEFKSSEPITLESKEITQEAREIAQMSRPPKSDLKLEPADTSEITKENPLKVIIAGGGIVGLALANDLLKDPRMHVTVIESAGENQRFGGHVELASNALQFMRTSDEKLYHQIIEKLMFLGDKENVIKDGIRDELYAKLDLGGPAQKRGMPYTGIIDRPDLQKIYRDAIPAGVVQYNDSVTSYKIDPGGKGVTAVTKSGATYNGDVVIGADGIWSNVRATMRNEPARGDGSGAKYSGYTVFVGEINYDSYDNGKIGYKVFIGPSMYFVITDIGHGRYQWYAFLAQPADSAEPTDSAKMEPKAAGSVAFLKNLFAGWSKDVHHILDATSDEQVRQRDLYVRPPSVRKPWTDGPVALVGDSVNAMMPNLGQGGAQALEDVFVLAQELRSATNRGEINDKLQTYRNRRVIRASTVQGLSSFASDFTFYGLSTPAKIYFDGGLKFENCNYAGIATKLLQPILPVFFNVQFNFLYRGWANEMAIDYKAALGIFFIGLSVLLAAAGIEGEIGAGLGFGLEAIFGGDSLIVLGSRITQLGDWFNTGLGLVPDQVKHVGSTIGSTFEQMGFSSKEINVDRLVGPEIDVEQDWYPTATRLGADAYKKLTKLENANLR